MDWGAALSEINYIGVLLAVAASFVIGFVWYEPRVFGEVWRKGAGLSKKEMQSSDGMGRIMGLTALFSFVSTLFLAALLIGLGVTSPAEGALSGAILGFMIVGLRLAIHNNFAKKTLDHSMVEAGYDVVVMSAQAAIIAWFM